MAQPPAAPPPQLPDNVRYLFKPVLTQTASAAEPVVESAEPAQPVAEPADDEAKRPPGKRPPAKRPAAKQPTASRPSASSAGALAADQPRPDRPDRPDRPGSRQESAKPPPRATAREPSATPDAPEPQPKRPTWIARPGHHRRAAAAATKPVRRRVTGAAAILIVLAAGAGTTVALISHTPGPQSGQAGNAPQHSTRGAAGRTGAKALTGLSSAAIVRGQAARWIAKEISTSAIIACDDVMCSELFNQGLAASNLLVLSPTAPDPLGADVVVGTPALRSQFGPLLAREYAPTVMASFGVGKSRVDVRAVAPYGAAAYEAALSHDLAARQRFGGVLLRNSRISLSGSAQPDLIAGLVDPRLLAMLPVLAAQHPIEILGFYDRAPRSAQGVPLTGAELAGNDTAAGLPAGSYLRWLLVFLRGQRAPYRPTSVSTALVSGREVVWVRFARPSPLGLLSGQ